MENFQHALYDFDTTFNPNEKLHGDTEDILENEELEEMLRSELDVEDEEVYDEIESKIEKSGKGEEE
jgi:hypothetical protein